MKIVSKEIKPDGSEFIVYLIDTSHGRPIEGFIVKKANKGKIINYLLHIANLSIDCLFYL